MCTTDIPSPNPFYYQYAKESFCCGGQDSNLRPQGYEPCELPTAPPRDVKEPIPLSQRFGTHINFNFMNFSLFNI